MNAQRLYSNFLSLLLCGGLLLAGCQSGSTPPDQAGDRPGASGTSSDAEASGEPDPAPEGQMELPSAENDDAPPEVTLEVRDWDAAVEVVAEYPGKVVVIDVWATYCAPCLVEFPNLVKLHREHGNQIACVSISLDYQGFEDEPVESYRESVLSFLKSRGATFRNLLCSTDSETVYNQKLKQGSIPVVFVYDQQGKLAGQFPNPENPAEFTYQADIFPLVEKLLNTD